LPVVHPGLALAYGPQTSLQLPQFCGSVWVFVQLVPHVVLGVVQTVPHVPPAHTWPVVHILPQTPQLLPSVLVLVHALPQKVSPVGQPHVPPVHDSPPAHA
jgi:hypothetical protein